MGRLYMLSALVITLGIVVSGCDLDPASPENSDRRTTATPSDGSLSSMANSNAPFQVWRQGFEHGTEGWYDKNSPGALAWCGSITRVDRRSGDITPSAGRGYALVEVGECDPTWTIFEPSGPYSPGAGPSSVWPRSGFVQELDIYLDPAWEDRTGFTYVGSFQLLDLDEEYPFNLRYFFIPVARTGGALTVGGFEVTSAGWYTFRHLFRSGDEGELVAFFELARKGRTLFSEPLTTTAYTGESTSSFRAENVGSGYIWFESYPASFFGTDFFRSPVLPIDEHRVRPGR